MAELLRASGGHLVTTAGTGEDGLRSCREEAYDLIVTDIGLQEMSGLEMLDRIRLEDLIGTLCGLIARTASRELASLSSSDRAG
jgi:CheY-like chemotaxis protein